MAAPNHTYSSTIARFAASAFVFTLAACGPFIIVVDDDDGLGDYYGTDSATDTISEPPLDAPSDCQPGTVGCECALVDLDADGIVPHEGECFIGLVCSISTGICEPAD